MPSHPDVVSDNKTASFGMLGNAQQTHRPKHIYAEPEIPMIMTQKM